jgi:hypothetical protein
VIAEVVMIAAAIAWVALYAHVVAPGHDAPFYEAHAGRASPWVAAVAGVPCFYFAAKIIARRAAYRAVAIAGAIFAVYALIDLSLLAASNADGYAWLMVLPNYPTKALAAFFGARASGR